MAGQARTGRRKVAYDHVMLFDFTPIPPFQHVSCMPIAKLGLDDDTKPLQLTRLFRLTQRKLNIYEDQHTYLIIAKTDTDCDNVDRGRAVTVLNDFVYTKLKEGVRIDHLTELLVDTFDSRLVKLVPYVPNYQQPSETQRAGRSARRRPIISSSEHEDQLPPKRPTFKKPSKALAEATRKRDVIQAAETADFNVPLRHGEQVPDNAAVVAQGSQDAEVTLRNGGLTPLFVQNEQLPLAQEASAATIEPNEPPHIPDFDAVIQSPSPANNSIAPTVSRRHRSTPDMKETPSQVLLTRMDNAAQTETRRYTKVASALKFITCTLESLVADVAAMRSDVNDVKAFGTMNATQELIIFPLQTVEEVDNYVKTDTSMGRVIAR